MRHRARWLSGVSAGVLAVLAIVVAIQVNVVTGYFPASVVGRRWWWVGGLAVSSLVIFAVTVWSPARYYDGSGWARAGAAC